MNLLSYEFIDAPEGSYNGVLKKLVSEIRFGRTQITIEDFQKMIPNLRQLETILQRADDSMNEPKRNYIQEIMAELDEEEKKLEEIQVDLERATCATIKMLFNRDFDFSNLSFEIRKAEHYHLLEFLGYIDGKDADVDLITAKDVFKSIGAKYDFIFIDFS